MSSRAGSTPYHADHVAFKNAKGVVTPAVIGVATDKSKEEG